MAMNEENIFIYIQKKENNDVIQYLNKVGIDTKDPEGRTSLLNAAFYNNLDLADWLLNNGANIDSQDINGYSALHFACQEGHYDMVKLLIDKGANINIIDENGNTPAWVAIMHWRGGKNLPILKKLYNHKADLSIKNKAGNSANKIIPQKIMEQL